MVNSVTGSSNVMRIQSLSAFTQNALKSSEAFIQKAQQITQGASGASKINVVA